METKIEYCVTYGFEGSGWVDGETFGSEDEAVEAFRSAVDFAPVDEHRYYVVALSKRARTYYDGDVMTDVEIEKMMEERI